MDSLDDLLGDLSSLTGVNTNTNTNSNSIASNNTVTTLTPANASSSTTTTSLSAAQPPWAQLQQQAGSSTSTSTTQSGIQTSEDGPPCDACGKGIPGFAAQALGKKYHVECFVCCRCEKAFGDNPFFEHEGKVYCADDYQEMFGVRCASCLRPITDKCVNALGKKWHPEHFRCASCDVSLSGKRFAQIEGEPHCHECKMRIKSENDPEAEVHECGKCGKPIYGDYIMLQGKYIHPEHFSCHECGAELRGGQCFEFDNELYCEYDYNKLIASCCAMCKKKIDGRALNALGRQFHPECFACSICESSLSDGQFYEKDGKAYCETHYYSLFGKMCANCEKPITGKGIYAIEQNWHETCFLCVGCNCNLAGKVFLEYENKPVCKKCFNKLPKEIRKAAEKARKQRQKEEKARLKAEKKASKNKK
eukprot:TRINITY_DN248_c0_g1_i3.p1 TRINITY_DN248_c0_g1~~TRINITY_DN248_c0_g1_i3.p1  ORF type:complete len:420 (+),score=122.35 TRINITY_DN248_c0_g1_i3:790-2049(+)